MSYLLNSQSKMAYKAQHTLNGVQLEMISYTMAGKKGKRFIEAYTQNQQTKMFMEESSVTGKTLKIVVLIDGYRLMLSNQYEMGMALHIFTDLVNKISNK